MIKINSLQKYFNRGKGNEIHVLNDITMELPERGMVAIFGRSGCGKTTLLNVIGGLDSYLSGSVEIDGEKITDKKFAVTPELFKDGKILVEKGKKKKVLVELV